MSTLLPDFILFLGLMDALFFAGLMVMLFLAGEVIVLDATLFFFLAVDFLLLLVGLAPAELIYS